MTKTRPTGPHCALGHNRKTKHKTIRIHKKLKQRKKWQKIIRKQNRRKTKE